MISEASEVSDGFELSQALNCSFLQKKQSPQLIVNGITTFCPFLSVLFGPTSLGYNTFSGFRFHVGKWCCEDQVYGFEGIFLFNGRASADGFRVQSVPNANPKPMKTGSSLRIVTSRGKQVQSRIQWMISYTRSSRENPPEGGFSVAPLASLRSPAWGPGTALRRFR